MEWASQLGLVVFLLASGSTGGRLLWRGIRGGGVHERLLGITYFLGGPLGYVPLILVVSGATPDAWTPALRGFGHLNLELSALALYAFNRLVFRPSSQAWGWATRVLSVGLVAGWLGLVFVDGLHGRLLGGSIAYWIDFSLRAGAYVWAAAESLHHHVLARRRLQLGLADPVVADRFLLWGIAMSAVSAMFVNAGIAALSSSGAPPAVWYLLDGCLAVIASSAMWVTFFPPHAYLAWVARRTAALRA
jgi:hypothetical protein